MKKVDRKIIGMARIVNGAIFFTVLAIVLVLLTGCMSYHPLTEVPTPTNEVPTVTEEVPTLANTLPTVANTPVPTLCIVNAESLHLRAAPGTEYAVLDYLHEGRYVKPVTEWGGWTYIGIGWVKSEYLTCQKG